jgi:uncharacterized protein YukE
MSVAKPRNRLVYFRVSEEEFQKFSSMCQGNEGARSISDLARSAVTRLIADKNGEGTSTFEQKLENLQTQVQMLTELLIRNQRSLRNGAIANEPTDDMARAAVSGAMEGN